jgi:hypothetical protein
VKLKLFLYLVKELLWEEKTQRKLEESGFFGFTQLHL